MTAADDRTVFKRIVDASAAIAQIDFKKSKFVVTGTKYNKETKQNEPSGYYIIPIAQILDPIRKAYAKEGLFITISQPQYDEDQGEARRREEVTTSYGDKKEYWAANGHVEVQVVGANGDIFRTTVACEAREPTTGDKLTNKLITNALRNYLRVAHQIDADDAQDPEELNGADPEPAPRTPPANDPLFGKKKTTTEPKAEIKTENKERPTYADQLKKQIINLANSHFDLGTYLASMLNGRRLSDITDEIELKAILHDLKTAKTEAGI